MRRAMRPSNQSVDIAMHEDGRRPVVVAVEVDREEQRRRPAPRARGRPSADRRSVIVRGEYVAVFSKVLVANRGEIAIRVFRALRELGLGIGRGLLRRRPRARSTSRVADEAFALGGRTAAESYLDVDEAPARRSRARAPRRSIRATGSSPRTPAFARAVEAAGARLDRPAAGGDRADGPQDGRARRAMQAAGVPIVPGTTEPVGSAEEVVALGEELGYPLVVKAAAGGGGKGMQVVASPDEAASAFESAQREGRVVLRRRGRLRRALPRGPAPRRGAGARRRARQRDPPRRARLHDPAPPPEARRGDAVAGGVARAPRADRADRGRRRARRRLPLAPGRSRGCSRRTATTTSSR